MLLARKVTQSELADTKLVSACRTAGTNSSNAVRMDGGGGTGSLGARTSSCPHRSHTIT